MLKRHTTKRLVKHTAIHPKQKLPIYQRPFRDWLDEVGGDVHCLFSKYEEEGRICSFKIGPGTNASHFRMVCTNTGCGYKKSVPKPPPQRIREPDTCPHENLTRNFSSQKFVCYFCKDCHTVVEKVSRGQDNATKRLANQTFLTSTRIQKTMASICKDPENILSQAAAVAEMLKEQALDEMNI